MKKYLFLLLALPLAMFADIQWTLPAVDIFNVAGQAGQLPMVTIDPNGNALAVWVNDTAGTFSIQSSYRPVGVSSAWSAPVTLSSSSTPVFPQPPYLSMDQSGYAIATWLASNGTNFVVQTAMRQPGVNGSWTPLVQASASGQNSGQAVAAWDNSGNAYIVWSISGGVLQATSVNKSQFPFLSPSTAVNVSATGTVTSAAAIASNSKGEILVAWIDATSASVQSSTLSPGGSWSSPLSVSPTGQLPASPVVTIAPSGDLFAMWSVPQGSQKSNIWSGQKAANALSWSNYQLSSQGSPNPNQFANYQIVVDKNETATAIWIQEINLNDTAVVSTKAFSDTSWPAFTIVSPGAVVDVSYPQLGIDCNGDLVAIWATTDSPGQVQAVTYPAGGSGWSTTPLTLSTVPGTHLIETSLAINCNGQVVGGWTTPITGGTAIVQSVTGFFQLQSVSGLQGSQKANDFALVTEYFTKLTWLSSPSVGVAGYNIYLNDSFLTSVGPGTLSYEVHDQVKGLPQKYTVTAFNSLGEESTPVSISVN